MSISDPIANILAIIRNGQQASLARVQAPHSRLSSGILHVLESEGYIEGFEEQEERKGIKKLIINLKYYRGKPVIQKLKRVSKPGCRVYSSTQDLKPVYNGLGISILSTSKGILPEHTAREMGVGGEVLCHVF